MFVRRHDYSRLIPGISLEVQGKGKKNRTRVANEGRKGGRRGSRGKRVEKKFWSRSEHEAKEAHKPRPRGNHLHEHLADEASRGPTKIELSEHFEARSEEEERERKKKKNRKRFHVNSRNTTIK